MTTFLEIDAITKKFGGFIALDNITITVGKGERVGLIGPNGSGKSTMVNCLSGVFSPELGAIRFLGQDLRGLRAYERTRLGVARSFQLPKPFRSLTIAENVRVPLLYGRSPPKAIDEHCHDLLARVALQDKADWLPASLTQVELRKLELIRAVATEPKLLLADEAMAGLSGSEVTEIVAFLRQLSTDGVTIIMIEHIMSAVMSFSDRLVVLVSGKKVADGDPQAVVKDPIVESAYLGQ
ncbi:MULTISPECIES: ABC transporter ATP-binding protein [unclassified Beijerinckia]|uniref:ABC transporter ATP-binding protein n=1 Tax=unclassified Beijerinckia TaxID=2638183 RepID=UPI00089DA319|nr:MULTISPECIES: ABC transporter ATP-binding protein [unclassified Beijerinckia]MDH7796056.1 branched-chain amino acid transport system ATP-binding protein [Beijerinckia sp. GAS462]SEC28299.1 branched-chain amino acid transport system ATP-binding protein [Beijerinckia sp. 28-YEA-48]